MRRLSALAGLSAGSLVLAFALVQLTGLGRPSSAALVAAKDVPPEPFVVQAQLPCQDIPVKYLPAPSAQQVASRDQASGAPAGAKPQAPAVKSEASAGDFAAGSVAPAEAAAPPPPPSVAAMGSASGGGGLAKSAKVATAAPAKSKMAAEAKQAPAPSAPASPPIAAADKAPSQKPKAANKPAEPPAQVATRPAQPDPFPTEPTTKFLSADDSNSMASPAIARRLIRSRKYVHPDYVRSYEFLNYYSFNYPAPQAGAEIAVVPEMRAGKAPGEFNLQIGVRALDRARSDMKPLNAVLLLDVSGSMSGESYRLGKEFIKKFVRALRPGEKVSLVTANRTATRQLEGEVVGPATAAKVDRLVDGIYPTDVTNLEAGIAAAYQLASKTYGAGYSNRVIIVSDGAANAGELSKSTIGKNAEDADRQGIYLAGIAVGEGFDDSLMNAVTDKGRGAYAFLDSDKEIERLLTDREFVAAFDVAVKDVRLKLVLPAGWKVKEFHGEQMSSVASEVVPQYLSPNDQMLYHLVVATNQAPGKLEEAGFQVEAEYRPIGAPATKKLSVERKVKQLLGSDLGLRKGDAVVRYAESLKKIAWPLEANRAANTKVIDEGLAYVGEIYDQLKDPELRDVVALMKAYRITLTEGEAAELACDRKFESPPVVLGLRPEHVRSVVVRGPAPQQAVKAISRLYQSTRLLPLEGYRFLALASGPVGDPGTTGGQLFGSPFAHPSPKFMGQAHNPRSGGNVFDLHQVVLELKAPQSAHSFSFDFNYFSAEYPEYVGQQFNDTFLAILQAKSTNEGASTNISFDPNGRPIEVNNNYFENKFHPIPNTGTGFDSDGSTGWLRTSWPIQAGESFTLTFSIHDEGDGVYTSLAALDNFQFHDQAAVGSTDPLN